VLHKYIKFTARVLGSSCWPHSCSADDQADYRSVDAARIDLLKIISAGLRACLQVATSGTYLVTAMYQAQNPSSATAEFKVGSPGGAWEST
jgi:hypothetical protein